MKKIVKIPIKDLVKKLKTDKKDKKDIKLSPNKMREFALTSRVTESPNKNWALDYYKGQIFK